jgi:hypothetical protein
MASWYRTQSNEINHQRLPSVVEVALAPKPTGPVPGFCMQSQFDGLLILSRWVGGPHPFGSIS